MKIFHCDNCGHLVFFESFQCLHCGRSLAYMPEVQALGSLQPSGEITPSGSPVAEGGGYRRCSNYALENVCNWAVASDDPNPLCRSCRLTRIIPDLSRTGNRAAWYKMESAKRRLVYSLMSLDLPMERSEGEESLQFEFLADDPETGPAPTGHTQGVITVNLAEADDPERERRRTQFHEPYRTLLGHFRHEIGHYYWGRLIGGTDRLQGFRSLFGDERLDYAKALERHYREGAPAGWRDSFVSAYSGSHPSEDWAESFAHYLHMVDALETAAACGLSLKPRRSDEPALRQDGGQGSFDRMIGDWFPLTYVLNNLNRSLGQADGYPFVLSAPAVEKLRFVHATIEAVSPRAGRRLRP